MRNRVQADKLVVQAIAGTYVVLLGIDLPKNKCAGLLGFAIRRHDKTEGESYWLSAYKTFNSVEPNPAPGVLYSTRLHPIQGFSWSDFSAKPGHDYEYEVIALRGKPNSMKEAEKVIVPIRTESEAPSDQPHHIHFNRGASASQEYTRRFGDKKPDEVGQAAYDWLSRGAAEAIAAFIGRAKDGKWALRVGACQLSAHTGQLIFGIYRPVAGTLRASSFSFAILLLLVLFCNCFLSAVRCQLGGSVGETIKGQAVGVMP
jgi:hypothetical protein